VERIPELATAAETNLAAQGVGNASVVVGDGSEGLPDVAPFDAIVVAAAHPRVPPPLADQLAEGGRLVQPIGRAGMSTSRSSDAPPAPSSCAFARWSPRGSSRSTAATASARPPRSDPLSQLRSSSRSSIPARQTARERVVRLPVHPRPSGGLGLARREGVAGSTSAAATRGEARWRHCRGHRSDRRQVQPTPAVARRVFGRRGFCCVSSLVNGSWFAANTAVRTGRGAPAAWAATCSPARPSRWASSQPVGTSPRRRARQLRCGTGPSRLPAVTSRTRTSAWSGLGPVRLGVRTWLCAGSHRVPVSPRVWGHQWGRCGKPVVGAG
jgi:hypothetical protein